MEIGYIKLYIENDIFNKKAFFEKERNEIESISTNESSHFLDFDIESNTIEDFIDYLEFSDIDKLFIISNSYSTRLKNILDFIKEETGIVTSLQVIDNIKESNLKLINFQLPREEELTLQQRLKNSYLSFNSGFYTTLEKVNIKHLYIEKMSDLKKIDKSILINCSINSLIITDEIDSTNTSFSKVISYDDFMQYSSEKFLFESLSYESIKETLKLYLNTGEISNYPYLVKDLGKYLKNKKINSLFFKEGKIYYDTDLTMILSNNSSKNTFELLNNLNDLPIFNEFPDTLIFDFYLISMLKQSNSKIKRSVSKFTTFNSEFVLEEDYNEYDNWIGYVTDEENYYLYNKLNNKTYMVNDKFMEIYEYLIKSDQNKLNLIDKNILQEAKELLNDV
ncbi:Uncharacterised protein [Streptococcus pneumoniae]|uniref:hypothetical protein n=1 Tax=Streptococcus pneumoniae TaxID=1313 RepID=UPI0005E8EF0B|nr:hypothetical protein [Streptococcus pneumoniae]CIT19142.1 Uncharacterised protein [Streptococcus pneumoniae]